MTVPSRMVPFRCFLFIEQSLVVARVTFPYSEAYWEFEPRWEQEGNGNRSRGAFSRFGMRAILGDYQ
jgi:hypothetical protein